MAIIEVIVAKVVFTMKAFWTMPIFFINFTDEEKLLTFPSLPTQKDNKKGNKGNNRSIKKKEEVKQKETIKRGQKSKLKRIKEKYKDQDEEERAFKMELLQVSVLFLNIVNEISPFSQLNKTKKD